MQQLKQLTTRLTRRLDAVRADQRIHRQKNLTDFPQNIRSSQLIEPTRNIALLKRAIRAQK